MTDGNGEPKTLREPFIQLPRGVLSQDEDAWFPGDQDAAYTYAALTSKAAYRDHETPVRHMVAPIKVGQVYIKVAEFAKKHGYTTDEMRHILRKLTKLRFCLTQRATRGLVVTICNYEQIYLNWPDGHHSSSNSGPTLGPIQRSASLEREIENQIPKESPKRTPAPPLKEITSPCSDWDLKAATWLRDVVAEVNPAAVQVREAKVEVWAQSFRLLREKDGQDIRTIERVLIFTFREDDDPFWRTNIQSAATFRAKWDQLAAGAFHPKRRKDF